MKNFIIILDGPMGAGKTTIGELLHKKLKRTALINMDRIKWFISDFRRSKKDNAITTAVMLRMCDEYLNQGINLIIAQGFWKNRPFKPFTQLEYKHQAKMLVYHLDAPKEVLLKRLSDRPLSKQARTKIAPSRILRNIRLWKTGRLTLGQSFETDKMSPTKIVQAILKDLYAL